LNRTQKHIIGWGLVIIGVLMVAGAVVRNDIGMFQSPLLYLGLVVVVAGVVLLNGEDKTGKPKGEDRSE